MDSRIAPLARRKSNMAEFETSKIWGLSDGERVSKALNILGVKTWLRPHEGNYKIVVDIDDNSDLQAQVVKFIDAADVILALK